VITLNKITKKYSSGANKVTGIENINFSVRKNEFVSIIGPTGTGKSTLLRIIAGLLPYDSGTVYCNKQTPAQAVRSGLMGFVPQQPLLLPNRTVRQNIELPLEIKKTRDNDAVTAIIELVGLKGFEDFYPHQLSGGMKQKAAIACALVYNPKILLMDEPFSSLDMITREKANYDLISIKQKIGQTVIFVTHNIEEAVFLSDRVVFISGIPGKIISDIPIKMGNRRHREIMTDESFFNEIKKVRKVMAMA
jgi:NitT/TauT family transport system ATP-binding protein